MSKSLFITSKQIALKEKMIKQFTEDLNKSNGKDILEGKIKFKFHDENTFQIEFADDKIAKEQERNWKKPKNRMGVLALKKIGVRIEFR